MKEVQRITELRKRYNKPVSDDVARFIQRIGYLEERFAKDRYANRWLLEKELLIAARDALKGTQSKLF